MAPAIEVEGLIKTYKEGMIRGKQIHALNGVSLSVERGKIFGLLGHNGAGKTTLIKILLGLVRKTQGSASLRGYTAGDRRGLFGVGYLPEHHRIPRHLTANSALIYYGGLSGLSPREVRAKAPQLLDRVGLGSRVTTSVRKYSKGMLQRLGLAQAMLHNPELLILDEPTDGVDPVGRREMRELLRELKEDGKTIFINSHLLQEVELVCDRVAILVKGEVRRIGDIDEIRANNLPKVEFLLATTSEKLQSILPEDLHPITAPTPHSVRFVIQTPTLQRVNSLVDQFRSQSIDIISITTLRNSLEDVFLDVVTQSHTSESKAGGQK